MLSKKEQDRLYYLKHREERIAYSKNRWEEKAKAYNEPDLEGEGRSLAYKGGIHLVYVNDLMKKSKYFLYIIENKQDKC